ncbi:MAG: hypothetical protein QMD00_06090 [Hadesarchaea archaeon]|nr:hypothetical protein [Hadesarchaea archaeon]
MGEIYEISEDLWIEIKRGHIGFREALSDCGNDPFTSIKPQVRILGELLQIIQAWKKRRKKYSASSLLKKRWVVTGLEELD